ncbi:putative chromatin remodeling & transcriptional activation HMG family [Helianthus annuus]|uniref:Chromatin remodeling & transcriptional activation HMG family n=1 Tax=Helianthus annuus TaxID=4232 RepID=A0A9K3N8L6_HELAN|nr:HMG1/2-like protein [Helianthus annuus]KAF5790433.1 putative chromatin remodeling & transcriptional activation HMG family [Helianthus annuus]
MAYQSRTRKRVNALRRAPDGSAFQTCGSCGVSIAIALADMHECESKRDVKKPKVEFQIEVEQRFQNEPRSEFRFFMESFVKNCDAKSYIEIDRKGFETWKNMSSEERLPYVVQAKLVNNAYYEKLLKESEDQMSSCVDEEVNSAEVGKIDKNDRFYNDDSYDSDSYGSDSYFY